MMTHVPISFPQESRPRGYSAASLRTDVRPLHQTGWRWLNAGWICVAAAVALSALGVAAISTTEPGLALRHVMHMCIGVVTAAVFLLPPPRLLDRLAYPICILVAGLLVFVLLPFVPESIVRPRHNARRWINVVITDFQPSELAKIGYVIALASYLKFRSSYRTLRGLLIPFVLTFIPMVLIVVEPDLGTALLFVPTLFAMLVAAGAKLRHLVLIIVLGLSIAPLTYPVLRPHQQNRIKAMVAQVTGDDRYDDGIGFQGAKARMLIGSGGLTGTGREKAADLVHYNSLPEEHNDMIFAVIACRWGLVGTIITWGLFATFCTGGMLVAASTRDPFARLVPIGLVAVMFSQMTINTGMTLGLLPITGMTLPFISAGGSSMIASWMSVGLLINIGLRRPTFQLRESFEFDGQPDE